MDGSTNLQLGDTAKQPPMTASPETLLWPRRGVLFSATSGVLSEVRSKSAHPARKCDSPWEAFTTFSKKDMSVFFYGTYLHDDRQCSRE